MQDPTKRFTAAAEFYHHRWPYHHSAIETLISECGLDASDRIVDLGSGNGLLSRPFLEKGFQVFCVEPNDAMRQIADRDLNGYKGYRSINAVAEATTLETQSVDLAMAGTALIWFDPPCLRKELVRISRPPYWFASFYVGWLPSALKNEYIQRIRRPEFGWQPLHAGPRVDNSLYFGHDQYQTFEFPEVKRETLPMFLGRICSLSTCPPPGTTGFEKTTEIAREIFQSYAVNDELIIPVKTVLRVGKVAADDL